MALRDLVEGECGGSNSLVRLTSHFVQDRAHKEDGLRHHFPQHADEGFADPNSNQVSTQQRTYKDLRMHTYVCMCTSQKSEYVHNVRYLCTNYNCVCTKYHYFWLFLTN